MAQTNEKRKRKYKLTVKSEKTFFEIEKSETTKLIGKKVIYDDNSEAFDFREYVTTEKYTGFTQKGFRLNSEQFKELQDQICKIK